jgi:predicted nuclease of predicted toxin-antitoxin system
MPESRLFASIYIDEDVTSRLAPALRQRGFEAIAAHEAGLKADDDELHLTYAAEHRMILLTSNRDDFIRLAHKWAAENRQHHGIVIAPQFSDRQFGELLRLTLSLLNRVAADDLVNTVCYLAAYR